MEEKCKIQSSKVEKMIKKIDLKVKLQYDNGMAFYSAKNYSLALECLIVVNEIVRYYDFDFFFVLGRCNHELGNIEDIIKYYKKSLKYFPRNEDIICLNLGILFNRRDINLKKGSKNFQLFEEVEELLKNLIKTNPNNDKLYGLGALYCRAYMFNKAIQIFEKTLKNNNPFDNVIKEHAFNYKLGLCYEYLENKAQSRVYFEKVINSNIDCSINYLKNSHFFLGKCCFEDKMYSKALYHFKKVLEFDEKYSKAYYFIGMIYCNQNKFILSMESLKRAIQIEEEEEYIDELENVKKKFVTFCKSYSLKQSDVRDAILMNDSGLIKLINQIHENNDLVCKIGVGSKIPKEMKCCVCFEKKKCCMFNPCKHIPVCITCSMKIEKCPLCRAKIKEKIKVFL